MARSRKTRTPAPAPRARKAAKRAARADKAPPPPRRMAVALLCVVLAGFALLFWARLKLVTGVPRTAYADPSANAAPGPRGAPDAAWSGGAAPAPLPRR